MDIKQRRIFLYIENVGRVPASDIQVVVELKIRIPWEFMPEDERPSSISKALGVAEDYLRLHVPFLYSYGKRTKLFPGGGLKLEMMIRLDDDRYLRDREFPLIAQDHARVNIRGYIKYSDGFNSGKITEFGFRYFAADDFWAAQRIDEPMDTQPDPEEPNSDYDPD